MAIRSKRSRATPETIVTAALTLARAKGWNAVTIRALADELGYASPILYEHFDNKAQVLGAAAHRGFEQLAQELEAVTPSSGTDERIVALGRAYVAFAQREPELYQAMHGLDGATVDPEALVQGAQRVCEVVAAELAVWARNHENSMPEPLVATEILWYLAHGIASLAVVGRSNGRIEEAVRTVLRGWR